MNPYLRNFLYMLLAALVSAVLGALFAAALAWLSPEFVSSLFSSKAGDLTRYAAAVGAVWGLFLGTGTMAFAILAAAVASWFHSKAKVEER